MTPANDRHPIRLIRSRDHARVVAVRMDETLSRRCWGFLIVSSPEGTPAQVLSAEEATAWVERERAVGQTSSKARFAALRASWAPKLGTAA